MSPSGLDFGGVVAMGRGRFSPFSVVGLSGFGLEGVAVFDRDSGSHLSHRTRKMGHPAFFLLRVNCAEGQKQRTGVSALHEIVEGGCPHVGVQR
jgi:hypothetical protein